MDVGHMVGNGEKGIILNSAPFSFGEVPQQYKDTWSKKTVSVVILENTMNVKK